jgi:uncharacterized protein YdeI (YjbR/CyaY-like superfamily)
MKTDPRVDAYIAKAQPFAQPILKRLRQLVHQGCPEVVETIKWGFAAFEHHGPWCRLASFKEHAVFGFWKHTLLQDPENYLDERKNSGGAAMGNLGRIASLKDLPPDTVLLDFIRPAKKLNEAGIKLPPKPRRAGKTIATPEFFQTELNKNKTAAKFFRAASHSFRKEYIEWIAEAKTAATRSARLAMALEWMAEKKARNWKSRRK